MNNKLEVFSILFDIFKQSGYHLYLVGGTVRDYLLGIELTDMDIVSDATPDDIKKLNLDVDYTFEKFGSLKLKYNGVKLDLTTLRKEDNYLDSRHPNIITFTKDIEEDYSRRDFSINAIYMDKDLNIIDPAGGVSDINNKIIRFIGDPLTRIKQDPLRIIRAFRFMLDLSFSMDDGLFTLLMNNLDLLKQVNPNKIKEELSKIKSRSDIKDVDTLIKVMAKK